MKTNRDLANEMVNVIKEEMKATRIYEVECSSKLPFSRFANIIELVKETLVSDYFVGNSKDNNLLVWERSEQVNQYVIGNLL